MVSKRPSANDENDDHGVHVQGEEQGHEATKHRGLLISSTHIARFLAPVLSRKTAEVRNFNCRVISKGTPIYLVESGVKDSGGNGVFRIVARAEFGGNSFVKHEDFQHHHSKHRCTASEYEEVRSKWQSDKGGCVLWAMKVVEILQTPLFVKPGRGEERF